MIVSEVTAERTSTSLRHKSSKDFLSKLDNTRPLRLSKKPDLKSRMLTSSDSFHKTNGIEFWFTENASRIATKLPRRSQYQ